MNILYLHGYGSEYKPDSDKVNALRTLGPVSGIDLDYGKGPAICIEMASEACRTHDINLIVGTSMGGWLASHVGVNCGIPFVALNPAISPSESLKKHAGTTVNYTGTDRTIEADTVKQYPPLATNGCGLVFCQEGDEVIDPKATINALEKHYEVHLIPGGSHRYENLDAQIALIDRHVINALPKVMPNV
jgi:hypothetical protein